MKSYARSVNATCPLCHLSFRALQWIVVDRTERPDLWQRCLLRTIQTVECARSHQFSLEGPLLLHDPQSERLIFSPRDGQTESEENADADALMERFFGSVVKPAPYMHQLVIASPREELPAVLTGQVTIPQVVDETAPVVPTHATATWLEEAIRAARLGRHEVAVAYYRRAVVEDPSNILAWFNSALSLAELGRHEEAITCCDRVLVLDPDDCGAATSRIVALLATGRGAEAMQWLQEPARRAKPHIRELYDFLLSGHAPDATAGVSAGPVSSLRNQAATLSMTGQFKDALRLWDEVIAQSPDDADAWLAKGAALGELGRLSEEVEAYRHAHTLNPGSAEILTNLGVALRRAKRTQEAIQCYEAALRLRPTDQALMLNMGVAVGSLGRVEEEVTWCDRVIATNPHNPAAWANRGWALFDLKRFEEASASFERALRIDPREERASRGAAACQEALRSNAFGR